MQRIVKVDWSPEEYAAKELERTMGQPEECPHCGRGQSLEAHGYYWRWVSAIVKASRVVRIRVRRFFVAAASGP
jgi:hypothetical protein